MAQASAVGDGVTSALADGATDGAADGAVDSTAEGDGEAPALHAATRTAANAVPAIRIVNRMAVPPMC